MNSQSNTRLIRKYVELSLVLKGKKQNIINAYKYNQYYFYSILLIVLKYLIFIIFNLKIIFIYLFLNILFTNRQLIIQLYQYLIIQHKYYFISKISNINDYKLQNDNLPQQLIEDSEITATNIEVIGRQPTLNVGTIGHVAHGKSTLTDALTKTNTVKHSKEKELNRTIDIGYANCKIYKCDNCLSLSTGQPGYYFTSNSSDSPITLMCPECKQQAKLYRHISIIDCPGHADFMRTTLSGVSWMDAVMLLVAADNDCPQSQTKEHVNALKLKPSLCNNLVVCQNKIDLVNKNRALINKQQIVNFLQQSQINMLNNKVIPISASKQINIKQVVDSLANIPIPERDFQARPIFVSFRSFSSNKSGESIDKLQSGILGGCITQGVFHLNDIITIRPGYFDKERKICYPLTTKIQSLKSDKNWLRFAVAGGNIAIGTLLDPSLTKGNALAGQVVTIHNQDVDEKFPIVDKLRFTFIPINIDQSDLQAYKFSVGAEIDITILGTNVSSIIKENIELNGQKQLLIQLSRPVCLLQGYTIAVSATRSQAEGMRLVGYGLNVENATEKLEIQEQTIQ